MVLKCIYYIIEGRITGKRPSGRLRQKTLDWTIGEGNRKTFGHLTQKAQFKEIWREWSTNLTLTENLSSSSSSSSTLQLLDICEDVNRTQNSWDP